MKRKEYKIEPIGIIHSPHKEADKTPIQPVFCKNIAGRVELFDEYVDGLKDLQPFSHIYLFYYFDRTQKTKLQLAPYLSDDKKGVFATRAPHRPNKLGMSLVRLDKIEGNILYVRNLDILNGTPLLDIKPYIKRFDSIEESRSGWQDEIPDETAVIRGKRNYHDNEE